jgi:hypothetical protein
MNSGRAFVAASILVVPRHGCILLHWSGIQSQWRYKFLPSILRLPRWFVWAALVLLAATAFFRLNADFPHYSRWMDDPSRYTDEGWYAAAALNHVLTGHWLRPGDFNPAVTVPLWPALLELIFHFIGISLALARALEVVFTIGTVFVGVALMASEDRRECAWLHAASCIQPFAFLLLTQCFS